MRDYKTEQAEQDVADEQRRSVLRDAAIDVVQNKIPRAEAIERAENRFQLQQQAEIDGEAVTDENGHAISFLESPLNSPAVNPEKARQVQAVFNELCENEGI